MDVPQYLSLEEMRHLQNLKREIFISKRGKYFSLKTKYGYAKKPQRSTRGKVTGFSDKARGRMLSYIASVDWEKIKYASLMTLTFPDEFCKAHRTMRNRYKSVFWRHMEKHLGRKIPGVFRWEWMDRKTGDYVGDIVPHLHVLLVNVQWFAWWKVQDFWQRSLGTNTYVDVDIRRAKKGEIASIYIAKYMSKVQGRIVLGNLPYGNTSGLHWGVRRRELIPMCPWDFHVKISDEEARAFYLLAAKKLSWIQMTQREGFKLLGSMSDEAQRLAEKMGLTGIGAST